jgi:MFS family permease
LNRKTESSKKTTLLLGLLLVSVVLAVGIASVCGIAAAAVTHLVQDIYSPAHMTTSKYEILGVVVGPISATFTIAQILLVFVSKTYHWALLHNPKIDSIPHPNQRKLLPFMALIITLSILRILLPTLYVVKQEELEGELLRVGML